MNGAAHPAARSAASNGGTAGVAPLLTVAMPMLRARSIAWLALESLARQQGAPPWELLMAQEMDPHHQPMPWAEFEAMRPRLEAAGMVHFRQFHLLHADAPAALSWKWRTMGREASPTSQAFVLQAADCYSPTERLKATHQLVAAGADWVHQRMGIFLDVPNNHRALYVHPPGYPTALNMAVRTSLVRNLPDVDKRKGVDRWLYRQAQAANGGKLNTAWLPTEHWRQGLDTHGHNNISRRRGAFLRQRKGAFTTCRTSLRQVLPEPVRARLAAMKKPGT